MELWEVTGRVDVGPVDMPQVVSRRTSFTVPDWQAALKEAALHLSGDAETAGQVVDISALTRLHKQRVVKGRTYEWI